MRRELAGFLDSAGRRGLIRSLELLANELWFDVRYGTETRAVLEGHQLGDLVGDSDSQLPIYHAINPLVFASVMTQLRALDPEVSSRGSFVDFGSGKGRALILAARAGFQRLVGIDYSPVLDATCRRNLAHVWRRRELAATYELHLGNATQFVVPDDSVVWFWFNPFDAASAERVAVGLLASLQRRPRPAYLIYARPLCTSPLQALGFRVAAEIQLAPGYVDALILRHPKGTGTHPFT